MKLLCCKSCGDIFNLTRKIKSCSCGKTKGQYTNELNAWYNNGIPLCISNQSLAQAIGNQRRMDEFYPEEFYGQRFMAWVCPKSSSTFTKENKEE